MAPSDPRNFVDKVVGACVGLLVAAIALYAAVRLVEAIWSALLIVLGVTALLAGAVSLLRRRGRGGW